MKQFDNETANHFVGGLIGVQRRGLSKRGWSTNDVEVFSNGVLTVAYAMALEGKTQNYGKVKWSIEIQRGVVKHAHFEAEESIKDLFNEQPDRNELVDLLEEFEIL